MDESKVFKENEWSLANQFIFMEQLFLCEKILWLKKRVELNFYNASCYNYIIYACILNL